MLVLLGFLGDVVLVKGYFVEDPLQGEFQVALEGIRAVNKGISLTFLGVLLGFYYIYDV